MSPVAPHAAPDLGLFVVVADEDARRFLHPLLRRAIERKCLSPFTYRIERDPMRDAAVVRAPERVLAPFLPNPALRVIVLWDDQGSGREAERAAIVEAEVTSRLQHLGLAPQDVVAAAFEPELEAFLVPSSLWLRVVEHLSARRNRPPPSDEAIVSQLGPPLRSCKLGELLDTHPKELFDAVLVCLGLSA